MSRGLSERARIAMEAAHSEATSRGADELSAAHLLVGLARIEGAAREVLEALGVDCIELVAVCRGQVPSTGEPTHGPLPFDESARQTLNKAVDAMRVSRHSTLFSAHLLAGIYHAGGGGRDVLDLVGVDQAAFSQALSDALTLSSEVDGAR